MVYENDNAARLRERNFGNPARRPWRVPLRLSAQLFNASDSACSPWLNASFETSSHHGAHRCLFAFHVRRSAARDQPCGSVTGPPSRRVSHALASNVDLTSASIRLNTNLDAPA